MAFDLMHKTTKKSNKTTKLIKHVSVSACVSSKIHVVFGINYTLYLKILYQSQECIAYNC